MPWSFQPACLPIAPSGLPYRDPSQALKFLLQNSATVLPWPQLPQRSLWEQSLLQSSAGFPGLVLDKLTGQAHLERPCAEAELDQLALAYLQGDLVFGAMRGEDAAGLSELLRMPGPWLEVRALSGHLVGPISLALQLTDEQKRPLLYNPMLLDAIIQHLALKAAWQTNQLANLTNKVLLCLEEPFLDVFYSPFCPISWQQGIEALERVFAAAKGFRGLILRGTSDWTPVLQTSVEVLVFDAYYDSSAILAHAVFLPGFFQRPGTLVWGLIPADEAALQTETSATLIAHFETLLTEIEVVGLKREKILQRALISTSGSLAHLSVEIAEKALKLCVEVSNRLRETYSLA